MSNQTVIYNDTETPVFVAFEQDDIIYVVSTNEGPQGAIGPPGVNIHIGDSAPSNPQVDLWVDTDELTPPQVTVSASPPADPVLGDLWVQL